MQHTTPITIEHMVVESNQPYEKVVGALEALVAEVTAVNSVDPSGKLPGKKGKMASSDELSPRLSQFRKMGI